MTASKLLSAVETLGIKLSARDGKLIVDSPAGVVDLLWLRDELASHKDALLELLTKPAEAARPTARRSWRDLPDISSGPRDYRKGDRWLPWHFNPDGTPKE
jgi:TubC N-terminal docking domain